MKKSVFRSSGIGCRMYGFGAFCMRGCVCQRLLCAEHHQESLLPYQHEGSENVLRRAEFPVRDKDVLYVSNAPLADFQKFVNAICSTLLPVGTTLSVTR